MIHHVPLRPPSHDFPADEWNIIQKRFRPEFLAQLETIMALGNGYLGMRGCPEEGGPNVENATLLNGFYETRPILYAEEAYGFAKTGQTIVNVTATDQTCRECSIAPSLESTRQDRRVWCTWQPPCRRS